MNRQTPASAILNRNGIRRPRASNSASGSMVTKENTPSDRSRPGASRLKNYICPQECLTALNTSSPHFAANAESLESAE